MQIMLIYENDTFLLNNTILQMLSKLCEQQQFKNRNENQNQTKYKKLQLFWHLENSPRNTNFWCGILLQLSPRTYLIPNVLGINCSTSISFTGTSKMNMEIGFQKYWNERLIKDWMALYYLHVNLAMHLDYMI